jgi:hypothetical protein
MIISPQAMEYSKLAEKSTVDCERLTEKILAILRAAE